MIGIESDRDFIKLPSSENSQSPVLGVIIVLGLLFAILMMLIVGVILSGRYDEFPCTVVMQGPGRRPIFGGHGSTDPAFTWLSGGKQILYQDGLGNLFSVDSQDLERTDPQLLPGLSGLDFDISSDDALIALSSSANWAVDIFNLQSGELLSSLPDAYDPIWSPDGMLLAVGIYMPEKQKVSVEVVNSLETSDRRPLIRPQGDFYSLESWSSDGQFLAVAKTVAEGDRVFLVNLDNGDIKALRALGGCQFTPAWAPDSRHIAYAGNPGKNDYDIYVQFPGHDQTVNLTNTDDVDEHQPSWSPDGRHLAYMAFKALSDMAFEQELYVVDIDSREARRLTNTSDEHETLPRWSPEGDKIAYLSIVDDTWYLNQINPDGSGQERLAVIINEE